MTTTPVQCPACKHGSVELVISSRKIVYRSLSLTIPPLILPECGSCKELVLNDIQYDLYSKAIDLAYKARLASLSRDEGNDIPTQPVTAIASFKRRETSFMRRWQERNRTHRETRGHSLFIFWTHKVALGCSEQIARYAADKRDIEGYAAGLFGILFFPFLGLPVCSVRAVQRAFKYVYYGE